MNRFRLASRLLFAGALFLAVARPAFAGGPLANCPGGGPFRWAAGGANIPFNPDQGDLGPLTHAAAVTALQDAFDQWGNIPSSTASYLAGPELPVDVDITNFLPYLEATVPDGRSAIVFDDSGEIFDALFGPGSGILGFAGPEFGIDATCTITEGYSFLNGPSFGAPQEALDVMVHEFGHYSNLAHTAVNGQIVFSATETSGPAPNDTFPIPPLGGLIETMYPFYFGLAAGFSSPHQDDIASLSTLYPEGTFLSSTAAIAGTIYKSDGVTRLSGVNVIARNVDDPFVDAVSAVSGDRTDSDAQSDPLTGTYRLSGLTPGAEYAVFVDQILAGGFSTPPVALPGAEEFHNEGESNNVTAPDDPSVFTAVSAAAGATATGVDVIFNTFAPGQPLPVGDDGFVELALPFTFKLCGQDFDSVFVNANGNLTFGAPGADFSESVIELLGGLGGQSALLAPPRIAGLWDDLDASSAGTVTFDETAHTFTVRWDGVPEFDLSGLGGSNTFAITLGRGGLFAKTSYGDLSATDGLAGLACGSQVTSGFEEETRLRRHGHHRIIDMGRETAVFEIFTEADNDLSGYDLTFVDFKKGFTDVYEGRHGNNTLAKATRVSLPFDTASLGSFTEISPLGGDVDYYRFRAKAGDILAIEAVRGSPDTLIGLFDADTGLAVTPVDDDSGCCGIGGLSRLLVQVPASIPSINLAVAVTSWPDFDFDGTEGVTSGRYVLVIKSYRGTILDAGDDTSTEVPLSFPFRYQGQNHTSVFVNSNGNLTFGEGDADFSESVDEFLAGPARIAPLWDDLDATFGLVIADAKPFSLDLHFVSVAQFFSASPNYFDVKLVYGGGVVMNWGVTERSDALVGLTEGGGVADPGETNLSGRHIISSSRTTYEVFAFPELLDLSFDSLLAIPY